MNMFQKNDAQPNWSAHINPHCLSCRLFYAAPEIAPTLKKGCRFNGYCDHRRGANLRTPLSGELLHHFRLSIKTPPYKNLTPQNA